METREALTARIYNWLEIGFQQPSERLSELFYFDKRDSQFFSILVADYFHFDENYKVPENAVSSYSEDVLELLADRMKRIDANDKSIIALPRTSEKITLTQDVLNEKIESFLDLNTIDVNIATIWDIDEIGSVTINLVDSKKGLKRSKRWWKFWK